MVEKLKTITMSLTGDLKEFKKQQLIISSQIDALKAKKLEMNEKMVRIKLHRQTTIYL